MAKDTRTLTERPQERRDNKWTRRRDIPIAILAWVLLVAFILWASWHIIRSLVLLAIAALLAFALAPTVKLLQRWMPRFIAILLVYTIVLGAISILLYFIVRTAIEQTISLSHQIRELLRPGPTSQAAQLEQLLAQFGISAGQISAARQLLIDQAERVAGDSLPILRNIIESIFDIVVVAILSIYLLLDGSRAVIWLRHNLPRATRADFVLDTLQRIVGGYIRGQLLLAALIGVLVGVGMSLIFQLPYAVFLGVLAFVMAFIPVLGTFISGTVCVLIGLTRGWPTALGVLIYFIVVHIIEGDIVGPRITGKAVGLHPVLSIFAVVAGSELFGIWGALFASPIVGVLQAIIIAIWTEWSTTHPEHFKRSTDGVPPKNADGLEDTSTPASS
jgi:predicted PurR-regulated permease PerM